MERAGVFITFVVRIASRGPDRVRGVVERVRTGREEQVHRVADIGRVIAAVLQEEERARTLQGKHALVTGGSRGIGRGIALKLAEHGAKVAVHYYVNEAAAKDTLECVRKHGADGFLVQADVSRVEDVKRMFAEVGQRFVLRTIAMSAAPIGVRCRRLRRGSCSWPHSQVPPRVRRDSSAQGLDGIKEVDEAKSLAFRCRNEL